MKVESDATVAVDVLIIEYDAAEHADHVFPPGFKQRVDLHVHYGFIFADDIFYQCAVIGCFFEIFNCVLVQYQYMFL